MVRRGLLSVGLNDLEVKPVGLRNPENGGGAGVGLFKKFCRLEICLVMGMVASVRADIGSATATKLLTG
jgi:hypothetical protein